MLSKITSNKYFNWLGITFSIRNQFFEWFSHCTFERACVPSGQTFHHLTLIVHLPFKSNGSAYPTMCSECIETVNYTFFHSTFPHDWRQFQHTKYSNVRSRKIICFTFAARNSLSLQRYISHTYYCLFHNVSAHFMISFASIEFKRHTAGWASERAWIHSHPMMMMSYYYWYFIYMYTLAHTTFLPISDSILKNLFTQNVLWITCFPSYCSIMLRKSVHLIKCEMNEAL